MAVAGSQTTRRDVVPSAAPLPTLLQAVRHWRRGAAPWLWSWRPFGHGPFIFGTLSPLPGECGGAEAVSEKEIGSSEVGTFSWSDSEDCISHSTSLKHIQSEWKRAIISQNGHWDPHPTDTWLSRASRGDSGTDSPDRPGSDIANVMFDFPPPIFGRAPKFPPLLAL